MQHKLREYILDKKKQNFIIYGLGQAFNLVTPLIVVPHIMAVCGESGLGKIAYGFALALFLILIVDYSFEIKGTKEASENRHNLPMLQTIFNATLFSKLSLFIGTSIIAFLLILAIPFFGREAVLFSFSMMIVLAQVLNPVWFLQGLENYRMVSVINICSKTLYLILVYSLVVNKQDYVLVNFFLGLSALLFNSVGVLVILLKYKVKIVAPTFNAIKKILKTDFSFTLSQLFLSVRQLSPLVLIGYFLGDFAAGQYKLIEQVITMFRTAIQVFLRYFYPLACYRVLDSLNAGFSFWKKYTTLNFLFVMAGVSTLFFMPQEVLTFFNASPQTVSDLTPVFRTALVIPVLMGLSLPLEQLMFIIGRHKRYTRIAMFVTFINVVIILLVIKNLMIAGVIISLIAAELLFIMLYFKNSYLHLSRKTSQ